MRSRCRQQATSAVNSDLFGEGNSMGGISLIGDFVFKSCLKIRGQLRAHTGHPNTLSGIIAECEVSFAETTQRTAQPVASPADFRELNAVGIKQTAHPRSAPIGFHAG